MKVWRPDPPALSSQELKELDRLKSVIQAAVSDGKLSGTELADIQAQVRADGKVTPAELELYRKLVTEKVAAGELEYEWG